MATKKIILKTAKARKGTVPRAAIRKAVQTVFGASKAPRPTRAAKASASKRAKAGALQA